MFEVAEYFFFFKRGFVMWAPAQVITFPRNGINDVFELQFTVGFVNSVRVNTEFAGKFAHGRQFIIGFNKTKRRDSLIIALDL